MQRTLEALKAQVAVEVLNEEAMTIEEHGIKEVYLQAITQYLIITFVKAIQNAQETCNDLILFDPQDLTNLKGAKDASMTVYVWGKCSH